MVSNSPLDGDAAEMACVPFVLAVSSVSSFSGCATVAAVPFVLIEPFPFDKLLLLISFGILGSVGIQLPVVRNFRGKTTCCKGDVMKNQFVKMAKVI